MQMPRIEEIRLAFLKYVIKEGVYEDSDLVVKTISEGFPAVSYLKNQPLPILLTTHALFSLRGEVGFIDELMVAQSDRGKMQGTRIYDAIESAFRECGVTALALYAIKGYEHGKDPQEFWKKHGFFQVGKHCFEKYL